MKNSIIAFLAGALTAFLVFFKMKSPDVVNVQGDQVNDPKIKNNSKVKNRKLNRLERRKARLEKKRLRKLDK